MDRKGIPAQKVRHLIPEGTTRKKSKGSKVTQECLLFSTGSDSFGQVLRELIVQLFVALVLLIPCAYSLYVVVQYFSP